MPDALPLLQHALGSGYRVDREVGRGAMAAVYLAQDLKHSRPVAIKVLNPDLSRALEAARFLREIEIAARLTHPNIIPLYDSGSVGGILYYVMPYVSGETLRARLERENLLAIDDVIQVISEIAEAVSYAHDQGVIHRDLKPENILFQSGHPLIADFGIAQAAIAAHDAGGNDDEMLTGAGVGLGTPSYMAPEQAAADPNTDYRADIYALGGIAYELLCGHPVFVRSSPQQTIAAHIADTPTSVGDVQPDVPSDLADLVMACLEKEPGKRPQSAGLLLRTLKAIAANRASEPLTQKALSDQRDVLQKALAIYAIASVLVISGARVATFSMGLPDWVVPGAIMIMVPGLPMIVLTALGQRRRSRLRKTKQGTQFWRHFTWRRTASGGIVAVVLFISTVTALTILGSRGIGPMATLLSTGKLRSNERLLLADFVIRGSDSTLVPALTAATRTALEQSNAVSIISQASIVQTLQRMQRPRSQNIGLDVAREIAEREGIKGIVQGEMTSVRGQSLIALRLFDGQSGSTLATFSKETRGDEDLIRVIDELSRRLRSNIGESLKNVRATPPLEQVTTASLDALRKYTGGVRAIAIEQNWPKAIQLFQEAIALDSGFALAWRGLGAAGSAVGRGRAFIDSTMTAAFIHSDRLPETERTIVTAMYHTVSLIGPGIEFDVPWRLYGYGRDRAKAARAYESLLRPDSVQPPYVLNLGLVYQTRRDFAAAESIYRGILRADTANAIAYIHLFESLFDQGKFAAAESLSTLARHRYSKTPIGVTIEATVLYFRNRHAELEEFIRNCMNGSPVVRRLCLEASVDYSLTRGRISDFKDHRKQARDMGIAFGVVSPIVDSVLLAFVDIEVLRDREQAVRRLDAAVAFGESLPPREREYLTIAEGYARAGEPNKARLILKRNAATITDPATQRSERPLVDAVTGYIALMTHNGRSAREYFRKADIIPDGPVNDCGPCLPLQLAYAYDMENQADSAISMFERYLNVPHSTRPWELKVDPLSLAHVYERLGQLYEQKGKHKEAKVNYNKFVELWSDADPVLQPRVIAARRRLADLDSLDRLQSQ